MKDGFLIFSAFAGFTFTFSAFGYLGFRAGKWAWEKGTLEAYLFYLQKIRQRICRHEWYVDTRRPIDPRRIFYPSGTLNIGEKSATLFRCHKCKATREAVEVYEGNGVWTEVPE